MLWIRLYGETNRLANITNLELNLLASAHLYGFAETDKQQAIGACKDIHLWKIIKVQSFILSSRWPLVSYLKYRS